MRNWVKKLSWGLAFFAPIAAWSAVPNIPSTSQYSDPSQIVATLNFLIGTINANVNPQTMATFNNNRNLIDNGAMQVSQRGTGTATCANNGSAIASANYATDRWGCEVNVGSGAGQLTQISATPSPPAGFAFSTKLVRNSGALTQPQCVYQEIPSYKATTMQNQNVVFSVNIQALAGLAADQGASTQTANLLIITGTGSDQGFGTWTASPALTPAWTGVATLVNTPVNLPTTPAWVRYQTSGLIGSTVTEIAVAVCFTPTASGSGTTDGIAITGAQLEQGTVASTYEFRAPAAELAELQRYYWQLAETNGTVFASGMCQATNVDRVAFQNPVIMRAAPTGTATAGGFSLAIAGAAATGITTPTIAASNAQITNLSAVNTCTAGATVTLVGTNTTGLIQVSADF